MVIKKDSDKVLGEFFDDERIKSFLTKEAADNIHPDYHLLEKAYRGMIAENFATFAKFFVEAGHDINAKNSDGKTFIQTITSHQLAGEYISSLKANGAT